VTGDIPAFIAWWNVLLPVAGLSSPKPPTAVARRARLYRPVAGSRPSNLRSDNPQNLSSPPPSLRASSKPLTGVKAPTLGDHVDDENTPLRSVMIGRPTTSCAARDAMPIVRSPTGRFGQTQRSCDGEVGKYVDGPMWRPVMTQIVLRPTRARTSSPAIKRVSRRPSQVRPDFET
jgi:hypothetical protein